MRYWFVFILSLLGSLIFSGMALHAQQLAGSHGNWQIFTANKGGKKLCYIASSPIKQAGNYTKRSAPYLLVTHVPNGTDEVSTSSGYRYKAKHEVKATIGTTTTLMFVQGEIAWAYDSKADRALIKQMIGGSKMIIKGTSWKDTRSTDTYSLKGFTAAYKAMRKLCK